MAKKISKTKYQENNIAQHLTDLLGADINVRMNMNIANKNLMRSDFQGEQSLTHKTLGPLGKEVATLKVNMRRRKSSKMTYNWLLYFLNNKYNFIDAIVDYFKRDVKNLEDLIEAVAKEDKNKIQNSLEYVLDLLVSKKSFGSNKESTIKRKGFDLPMVDLLYFLNNIIFEKKKK